MCGSERTMTGNRVQARCTRRPIARRARHLVPREVTEAFNNCSLRSAKGDETAPHLSELAGIGVLVRARRLTADLLICRPATPLARAVKGGCWAHGDWWAALGQLSSSVFAGESRGEMLEDAGAFWVHSRTHGASSTPRRGQIVNGLCPQRGGLRIRSTLRTDPSHSICAFQRRTSPQASLG
jgi:hypothetical protein